MLFEKPIILMASWEGALHDAVLFEGTALTPGNQE